ncbi:class I SAM-dependent methyltransferase [Halomonas sp. McH1-25]|uniref:class I SAM-dependent methyltransferase n=1 Tax=unclassified Halomonas TaxID=2609666 RepID=UPI001EF6FAF0|nr:MULTISPECIES: class I SAM-dependent methyltransferase [unclassified Halomonas]MCG7600511.1 class I SAM-dependent methyltransferase [Halomonas sp. McH1-25]MCP1343571.1 class I SAM-dependent methyltransferase [Halomonas sp. FL8]MCP1360018.1 class I SAM-dependent methyltransferase [Halomonas sp. BBD45]
MPLSCPLCGEMHIRHYHGDSRRDYWHCQICQLVFVERGQHLSPDDEKAVYDCHENSPEDMGYRRFLARLFAPLNERLAAGSHGLDFGCGPGPTLSVMFEEAGHSMALYDVYYVPDRQVLEASYDFITASEVVEHLAEPGRVLAQLADRLAPGGWLGLMTKRVRTREDFARWHYILDPTHVSFFSEATFEWLAVRLGMQVEFPAADVALLRKPLSSA